MAKWHGDRPSIPFFGVSPATGDRCVFERGDGMYPAKRIKGDAERAPSQRQWKGKGKYVEERGETVDAHNQMMRRGGMPLYLSWRLR